MKSIKLLVCILLLILALQAYAETVYPSCSDNKYPKICAGNDGNIYVTTGLNHGSRLYSRIALYRISPETLTSERLLLARDVNAWIRLSGDTVYFFETKSRINDYGKTIDDHIWYSMELNIETPEREDWKFLWDNDGENSYAMYTTTLTDTYILFNEDPSDDVETASIYRYKDGEYTYLFDGWGGVGHDTYLEYCRFDDGMDSPYRLYDGKENRHIIIDRSAARSSDGILLGDKLYMKDSEGVFVYDVKTEEKTHLFAQGEHVTGELCYDQSRMYVIDKEKEHTNIYVFSTPDNEFIKTITIDSDQAPGIYYLIVDKVLYNADLKAEKVNVVNLETMETTVISLDTEVEGERTMGNVIKYSVAAVILLCGGMICFLLIRYK